MIIRIYNINFNSEFAVKKKVNKRRQEKLAVRVVSARPLTGKF
jgi:hypothetical protein